jgi:hypothetical protein
VPGVVDPTGIRELSPLPRGALAVVAIIVVSACLLARGVLIDRSGGPHFEPRPDSLEYAATAQSLAQEGRFLLHVGPYEVPPRPAPGWPMVLAVAVRAGVPSESLWRFSAPLAAGHAFLLAVVAMRIVWLLAPRATASRRAAAAACVAAGLIAGCGWAVTPVSVDWNRSVMGDEPAALLANGALCALALALLRGAPGRRAMVLALLAGLAAGLVTSMRPVVGYLLAGPALALTLAGAYRVGVRRIGARLLAAAAGFALFVLLTMAVLYRSGLSPWEWGGYRFWIPSMYSRFDKTFSLDYALHGHPDYPIRHSRTDRPMSHLEVAARLFLGLPGLKSTGVMCLGRWWPISSWLCGAWLVGRAARRRAVPRAALLGACVALAGWFAGHVAVYSLYFYPSPRFYIAPAAWCWVFLAAACPLLLLDGGRAARAFSIASLAGTAWAAGYAYRPLIAIRPVGPDPVAAQVRAAFSEWLALSDEQRAARAMTFDPVHAQALGLLTPRVLATVREWGRLPYTEHAWRLRANGVLPPKETASVRAPLKKRPARPPASRSAPIGPTPR